jgi:putative isomerase
MKHLISFILIVFIAAGCQNGKKEPKENIPSQIANTLNYKVTPKEAFDKTGLMFSDQGAWFAYSFPDSISNYNGFSGPFLMTQQNGVWSSSSLASLNLKGDNSKIEWIQNTTTSYNSHLEQVFKNENLELHQKLVFTSGHTAFIQSTLLNKSDEEIELLYNFENEEVFAEGLSFSSNKNEVIVNTTKSNAVGHLIFPDNTEVLIVENNFETAETKILLKPNESKEIVISQTFIFPEYNWNEELTSINSTNFEDVLSKRIEEKQIQIQNLISNKKKNYSDKKYDEVLTKAHLTLQNNWRIAAGELKNEGLFPSYHYKWFNGFWSWDSWKHSVGLSYFNTELAKNQMRVLFDYQNEDGFIVDCIFRDTTIEAHNYRDTKPPLASWAVAKIFEKDKDLKFVEEMYPKLKLYHEWWYNMRDHDKDGLCEYGSTDGSLVAAKWESGMDNAIRFDDSKILKNEEGAYSLDQESVDLNAYLYAEKIYLANLSESLNKIDDAKKLKEEAEALKIRIQEQFYDKNDGWFYDTNLEGTTFIKGEGSEGWTALWANAATQEQAEAVKNKMMNPEKFYTKVPFQTMSADHKKFNPLKGYWRGPNWLDQAYFGVKGLRNYGFDAEANKATIQIIEGAAGVLEKGKSIRENYHPITGEGLNAQNFSWSAAHIIMLLMEE